MKKILLTIPLLLASTAFAKVDVSGYITPIIQSGAMTPSDDFKNEISVKNAAVEFSGEVNKNLTATVVLWADQDQIENNSYSLIDEAYMTQTFGNGHIKVGKSYLPFGDLGTSFVHYTEVYNAANTQADILEGGYTYMGVTAKVYTYESPAWKSGEKEGLNSYGAQLEYENKMVSLKLGYRTNLAGKLGATGAVKKTPGAYIAAARVNYMGFGLFAEYLSSLGEYDVADFTYVKGKVTPSVANIELTYSYEIMGKMFDIGVGYQMVDDVPVAAGSANLSIKPTEVITAGLNFHVDENAILKLEHKRTTDEKTDKGGATDGHTSCLTTLAYELTF